MTDYSESKEKKEPPKIKLSLSDDVMPPAASEPTKPSPEKTPSNDPPKLKIRTDAPAPKTDRPPEPPPAASSDEPTSAKPPIKLSFGSLDDVKFEEKETKSESADETKAGQEPPTDKAPTADEPADTPSEPKAVPPPPAVKRPVPSTLKLTTKEPDEAEVEDGKLAKAKSDTSKIDLSEAKPPPPKAKPPKAEVESDATETSAPSEPPPQRSLAGAAKSKTIRLNDIQEDSLEDLYQAALNATQRVILDEQQRKSETGPQKDIDESQALKKAEIAESSKKSTARLDLQEMLSEDDKKELLKGETMHIKADGEPAGKPGGTIKIKRPDEEEAKPNATMAISPDIEESRKSETARIDLPREVSSSAPPTQRKTIRIKRPEAGGASGATRPALSVARPPSKSGKPAEDTSGEPKGALKLDEETDQAHPAFTALAIIAVLVSLALVYVLAAMLSPGLPFPGRLV